MSRRDRHGFANFEFAAFFVKHIARSFVLLFGVSSFPEIGHLVGDLFGFNGVDMGFAIRSPISVSGCGVITDSVVIEPFFGIGAGDCVEFCVESSTDSGSDSY